MLLIIHPLVLGSGQRMFGADAEAHGFELVSAVPSRTGLLLATYRAAPGAPAP